MKTYLIPGVLGFYQSCQVNICCLLDNGNNAYNFFTIFTFEDYNLFEETPVFLTNKNERVGDYRLAIVQYRISLEDAFAHYQAINSGAKEIVTPLGTLNIGEVAPVPTIFVPTDSTQTIPLNRVIKNNFRGGSMVMEFFNSDNRLLAEIPSNNRKKITLRIHDLFPIDLFTISDRIGNILFQFPEEIASKELIGNKNEITCTIKFDCQIKGFSQYCLTIYTEYDHALMSFASIQGTKTTPPKLTIPDTGGPYRILLTDTIYKLPILQETTSMMRNISTVITLKGNSDFTRTINLSDGRQEKIIINSSELINIKQPSLPWEDALHRRKYQQRMSELMNRREFVQYAKSTNERERALNDLRFLMNVGPKEEVYL